MDRKSVIPPRKRRERMMSLYYRNLRRIGICTILVSLVNLVYELLLRHYLISTQSAYVSFIPLYWGIWVKNLIGVASGLVALFFHLKRRHYRFGTLILSALCAAEAAVIVMSMTGSAGRRANGIIDITMLVMVLLAYTFSQTNRDLRRWDRIRDREPEALDLRLMNSQAFFDPIQAGPKMAISREYAAVVKRYIASMRVPAPLQINLLCAEPVPESVRDTMAEVLRMHFEAEEARIEKDLEKRYRRILLLISVSVFAIGFVRQLSLFNEEIIAWEIIGNFAAFGLWQIGYTHYERSEDYGELLLVHIAKYATLRFVEK